MEIYCFFYTKNQSCDDYSYIGIFYNLYELVLMRALEIE